MDEREQAEQFSREVDNLLKDLGRAETEVAPESQRALLTLARTLAQTDLSAESAVRPSLRRRLLTGEAAREGGSNSQGDNLMRALVFRRMVVAGLIGLTVVIVALSLTPQGQAFAQSLLHFFAPAQENAFTLPTPKLNLSPQATPTFAVPLAAGCTEAPGTYRCAVDGAETALGFDIREWPVAPADFTFANALADPAQHLARLTYARDGSELSITQVQGHAELAVGAAPWDAVPVEAVEPVQINDVEGEYVRGMFVVKDPNGTQAVWEPDAPVQRLRWQEGDMSFEILLGGLLGDDEAIGRDWLIALAESLQ